MAQKKTNKGDSGMSAEAMVAVGAGAVALTAAGYYLLFGPEGKKHRKDAKAWMVKMKGEVMEKMEEAKHLTAPMYEAIVNEVGEKYKSLKNMDASAVMAEMAMMKKNWKALHKAKSPKKKPAAKAKAKPAAKKAAPKKTN